MRQKTVQIENFANRKLIFIAMGDIENEWEIFLYEFLVSR